MKKRGGLVLIGAILGIAIPLSLRLYMERSSQPRDVQQAQVTNYSSNERVARSVTSVTSNAERRVAVQNRETRSQPRRQSSASSSSSSWQTRSTSVERRPSRSTSTASTEQRSSPPPSRIARTVPAAPAPVRSVQRQIPIVNNNTAASTAQQVNRGPSTTQQNRQIAMVAPAAEPRVQPEPVSPPPPPPQPTSRFVSDMRLTYSTALLERCAADCNLIFRDSSGTLVRGSFPRSQFQSTLLQSGGEALLSGVVTMRQGQLWMEVTAVTSLRPPAVAEAPIQPVAEPAPPAPVASPPPSQSIGQADDVGPNTISSRPASDSRDARNDTSPAVSTQDNQAGVQRFHNRLRKIKGSPNQREAEAEISEADDEEEDDNEPYTNFHQRLRRTVGN